MSYSPPAVNISELSSPTVSAILAGPSTVAVVGLSNGAIRRTDAITLVAHAASPLPGLPTGATLVSTDSTVTVKDSYFTPSLVPANYDTGNGYGTADFSLDATAKTLARVATGGGGASGESIIADGTTVYVTYDYVPGDYFRPALYSDLASVEARFGQATDGLGAITCPLTFGAQLAFEGGASQLYVAPLYKLTTPSDPTSVRLQPNTTQAASSTTWQQTLYGLRDIPDINIVIPVVGQSAASVDDAAQLAIFHEVQDHCSFMSTQQDEIFAIFAEDSTIDSTKATKAIIRAHADDLRSRHGGSSAQSSILFANSKFARPAPTTSGVVYVGGQYLAAALGGLLASIPVQESPTRLVLSGASAVVDVRSRQDKLDDGGKGLLVLDDATGVLVIRHGITLDIASIANQQISVVRAKHLVIESVRNTLETQVLGATVPGDQVEPFVAAAVQVVLERLVTIGAIGGYSSIQARRLTGDPTTVEVRFDYEPLFPIDDINVLFSLDLAAQTVTAG